jgi:hypothetical protein
MLGGNYRAGRQVYPMLRKAGFREVEVSPCMVYNDASRQYMEEGFVRLTIITMVEGVWEKAIKIGIIDAKTSDTGIEDLHRTASEKGTFNYMFFKGVEKSNPVITFCIRCMSSNT